jgi:hypothetical protein
MATSGLYLLHFRDTSLWPKVRDDPDWQPSGLAGNVEAYLSSKGIIFDKPNGDGALVYSDGTVKVQCLNDPTAVWPAYVDTPEPTAVAANARVRAIKAFRDKANAGTLTPAEIQRGLGVMATAVLTLFRDPD